MSVVAHCYVDPVILTLLTGKTEFTGLHFGVVFSNTEMMQLCLYCTRKQ